MDVTISSRTCSILASSLDSAGFPVETLRGFNHRRRSLAIVAVEREGGGWVGSRVSAGRGGGGGEGSAFFFKLHNWFFLGEGRRESHI